MHSARRIVALFGIGTVVGLVLMTAPHSARAACNPTALSQVSLGMSGDSVSALQGCLIEAGITIPAGVTGYYGTQTQAAVSQFYATHMGMSGWNGASMGPLGRAKLASVRGGGGATSGGHTSVGYKRAGTAAVLAQYVAESRGETAEMRGVLFSDSDSAQTVPMANGVSSERTAERVSETTVQVAGIDEPDIVKTDGKNIFISKEGYYYGRPMPMMAPVAEDAARIMMPPAEDPSSTSVVQAFPPEELAEIGEIKEKGEMLLVKDAKILIILAHPEIVAYDISIPKTPVKKWSLSLENNTSLVTARLSDGQIYLVTQTWLEKNKPCPYIPIARGGATISIACGDIWVPMRVEPVQHAYTVLSLNPKTGTTNQSLSFAAEGDTTTVAVFKDNLYLATKSYTTPYDILTSVTITASTRYLSAATLEKVQRIQGYDISAAGKYSEVLQAISADTQTQDPNKDLAIETSIGNAIAKELEKRKRELDRTTIVRVALPTLSIAATGEVPGTLLNQFALDEYEGNLRVAVTVDGNTVWGGGGESVNDVYVLGLDLAEKGRVLDLGRTERVYAVRFMGEEAYVVTFRQIDPFYVLDLSIPTAPKVVGELKIPGYSAYLEPLGDDLVLGVGREGNGVKLSVFDVSNPAQPVEKSKYLVKESWTEVEGNHHAFLKDADHSVFFLPASAGGYVFSYADGELALKAAVAGWSVKRAVYLDDYLYIVGDEKITVLDEKTWQEVKTLTLK